MIKQIPEVIHEFGSVAQFKHNITKAAMSLNISRNTPTYIRSVHFQQKRKEKSIKKGLSLQPVTPGDNWTFTRRKKPITLAHPTRKN